MILLQNFITNTWYIHAIYQVYILYMLYILGLVISSKLSKNQSMLDELEIHLYAAWRFRTTTRLHSKGMINCQTGYTRYTPTEGPARSAQTMTRKEILERDTARKAARAAAANGGDSGERGGSGGIGIGGGGGDDDDADEASWNGKEGEAAAQPAATKPA